MIFCESRNSFLLLIRNINLLLFFIIPLSVFAQERHTLSGYLRDGATGEALGYATVYASENHTGVSTNEYGFFSITLPAGNYCFNFSYIGYQEQKDTVLLNRDISLNIELMQETTSLGEVKVVGKAVDDRVRQNETGTVKLDVKQLNVIPILFGEQDILKTIQLLPGVSPAGEGSSGFFVRGGNVDQNLILLDDAPVFNPSHLLGFFSVFNSDAIRDLKLYKGGVPARFGGRASSVMDIRMKEGSMKDYRFAGGIGLISSRFTAEGPIVRDRSSFMVSGRRTYADLFLPFSPNSDIQGNKLYFYDLNLKGNLIINDNNRLFLSGYFGRDVMKASDFGLNWGNKVGSLRWNHQFSPSLFLNTTLVINDYNYRTEGDIDGEFSLTAGIKDFSIKQDYTISLYPDISLLFGFISTFHQFKPGEVSSSSVNIPSFKIDEKKGLENAIYVFAEQHLFPKWTIGYGLRFSLFSRIGPGTETEYDDDANIISEVEFPKGEFYRNYFGLEPRVNLSRLLSDNASLKFGYNRMFQYIHLLSNSSAGTPIDYWLPSSNNIKPQIVSQFSAGYFKELSQAKYDYSIEAYYKFMDNQIDYRNGADVFLNEDAEAELLFGIGRSYGIEGLFRKNQGKLTGWVAYTLSRTEKQIDEINNSEWYPARQDRTHDLSIVVNYQLGSRWSVSSTWVYYTGNAVTFPSGKYAMDGNIVSYYTSRNGYRMPAYHRLDLGANLLLKKRENYVSELTFGIYNAYGRKNAYFYQFRTKEGDTLETEAVKVYLFSVIPSITWNFRF